jgi:hypothetical protein
MPNRYAYVGGDPVNLVDHTGLYPCGRDQYDPNCQRLEQALNASSNMAAKQAIQNAIFPPYYDQGATCPSDPSDSLKALQDALERHFPIESIKTGSGGDGLQTSHRVVLLRLAEAVLLIDRRLSLNTALSNELNITFDNVNAPEFGGESGGYVAEQNTTDYPMQLGNLMSTDDIVHEWGHVFNRENGSFFSTRLSTVGKGVYVGSDRGDCALEDAVTPYPGGPTYRRYVISGVVAASPQNYRRCHVGYGHEANSSRDPIEDWPDMFMNWVFDGYSGAQAGFDKVADDVEAASARRHWVDHSLRLSGIT